MVLRPVLHCRSIAFKIEFMFLGHFAVGFAAKRLEPKPSLGVYFAAAQFLDLLWPVLLLLGVEHVRIDPGNTAVTPLDFYHYPWSHSLLVVLGWSAIAAALGYRRYRNKRVALILAACVVSHWVLDLIVHRPDLPVLPQGGPRVGFSLWDSLAATVIVESLLFAAGLWLYVKGTKPKDRTGRLGWIVLTAFLITIWLGNFMGPPPPSVEAIAILGNLQWLFVGLAFWADRHRSTR